MIKPANSKREALPRDGTLWMASHRDYDIRITNVLCSCQVRVLTTTKGEEIISNATVGRGRMETGYFYLSLRGAAGNIAIP